MLALLLAAMISQNALSPHPPTPAPRQLAWQAMEKYAFVHFGPNTFTNKEWGEGKEDPRLFNPTALDCRQWARTAREAGLTGIILTAKHHDGFCLWPSKYSTHTVAQSPWRGGKGDVLRELSEACRAEGLKLGVYLSPWDRNHPTYGTPQYNQVFANMLREVLTQYGPIFEVWFDGANGEGPNGKRQVYDWDLFIRTVRELQPNAVIFSDAGPDIRWVGNEAGHSAPTCWSTIDRDRYVPGTPLYAELTEGKRGGTHWVPAECDVSIRPGWFYHADQDDKVKTPEQLMDLYERSVGQNANFLLNIPPDRRGLWHENDVAALRGWKKLLDETYGKDLAHDAQVTVVGADGPPPGVPRKEWITVAVDLPHPTLFDRIELREPIELGQRVAQFRVDARIEGAWHTVANGTTVGNKRILRVPAVRTNELRIVVQDALATPILQRPRLYASPAARQGALDTPAQQERRMKWWREARFGMFIHWGLYAIPAGVWNGKNYPGASEWLMHSAQIKPRDYAPLQAKFNPVKFDAREWVRIAKDAGMKYIVITSKHHDGFALWPTRQGDWHIGNTPFKRDVLKELAQACKEAGIRLCFYHSILDWTHPDYLPRRAWDDRDASKADFDRYVAFMKAQLKELLSGEYGEIGILWFDGEWEGTWTHERGRDLYHFVRSLQPKIIVNNRVDKGRSGMAGLTQGNFLGDYGTPEQEIPPNGLPGVDWESCMTMNHSWGFHQNDHDWKSAQTLVHNLIDCASKGGNYLLNVGPTALGEIPAPSVERLAAVGKWLRANGEAIYGTSAGPFPKPLPWGRVTAKPGKLYLHVFDPAATHVELPGLEADVRSIRPLGGRGSLRVDRTSRGYLVHLPPRRDGTMPTVFVAQVDGPVSVRKLVPVLGTGPLTLTADEADVKGHARYEGGEKRAIGFWTNASDVVSWEFQVDRPGEFQVEVEYACDPASAGSTYELQVGGSSLRGTVESTGGWASFRKASLGKLAIVTPGRAVLSVKAVQMPRGAVMNLRAVRLTRSPQ